MKFDQEAAQTQQTAAVAVAISDVTKRFALTQDRRTNLKEVFLRRKLHDHAKEFWALKGVTLDIPAGKTFGLIGHNGSGKSTLLKLVAGIHRPTSGTIMANGKVTAMLELGAGFHPELTGRENIYLNGSILGMTRKEIDGAIERIIDFSGLREFIDTPVKVYSSGMYVRLGFAIAVNLDPEILIIDEVIAVGDEEFQRKCFDHLFALRKRGVTIVLVSHSLGYVSDLCDEVAWLDHGQVKAVGPARDIVEDYLRQVNEAEAESLAEARTTDADDPAADPATAAEADLYPRLGSGEIRIDHVRFLDDKGEEVEVLYTGHPGTIRMEYTSSTNLSAVTFGLGFVHESNTTVAGPNSGYGDRAMEVLAGSGHVDFQIPRVPLHPGTYEISVAAVDKGHNYDMRTRAFTLRVRAKEPITEPGMVQMEGSWSQHSASASIQPARRP